MESIIFYIKFLTILVTPCLLAVILFKLKILKTVRSTYYFTPIMLAILLFGNNLFFYTEPKEPFCGFTPKIAILLLLLVSTPVTLFIQYVLNQIFKVNKK